jgi:hypothetical protein
VEDEGDRTSLPAKQEQRGEGSAVEKPEREAIGPVYFLWFGSVEKVGAHKGVQTVAFPTLTEILPAG